jgi:hypothetical protein
MRILGALRRIALVAPLLLAALPPRQVSAQPRMPMGNEVQAQLARNSILELDLKTARSVLEGADPADAALALEQGRLAIYEGECDRALGVLVRPDLAGTSGGAELLNIALGCARATAGTVVIKDEANGVTVRLQDDEDRALVPIMADVARRAREQLTKDLGVTLPSPIFIDLVRDQFTLAAVTGLPETAARTTGTVAVAKWGRVTMLSPRAMRHGYPWLDTLTHELTHLALTQGTRDKAPLWLQEGVAKREETRWRAAEPFDDFPPADSIAALGFERGLGVPIDKMGPSIAMLPSADHAAVAFAEVASFIRFWAKEAGDDALPRLLQEIKKAADPEDVNAALTAVSGQDFAAWDKRWRAHIQSASRDVPQELAPGGTIPGLREISRRVRLGDLLFERGHHRAAAVQQARAQALAPTEPTLRCLLAASLMASDQRPSAAALVAEPKEVHGRFGRWWSLHGLFNPGRTSPGGVSPFELGIGIDPLDPTVGCEEKTGTELPVDPLRAALCEAARRVPR